MEYFAIIVSAATLLFSVFSFLFFDRKIKKQEKTINAYKIKKIEAEELELKLARLYIRTYWRDKGTLYLIIENEGPSDAYNISIEELDSESFLFQELKDSFPIKTIDAGDSEQLELMVYCDMPEKIRIQVDWDDDSQKHHSDKKVISIS